MTEAEKKEEQAAASTSAETPTAAVADASAAAGAAPEIAKPLILGRKIGMLQHFKEDGSVVAATVIAADANVVTQVLTRERNGYAAIQLGFGKIDARRIGKPRVGHLKGLSPVQHLREIRLDDVAGFAAGQEITVERFAAGDKVHVVGVSKGKGFQGPVHLHHFSRGPKSHGSDHLRRQGSVGSGTTPGRVLKGMRMAAHQGVDRVTVRNLVVLRADPARSLLLIAGAVPGGRNALVMVRKA